MLLLIVWPLSPIDRIKLQKKASELLYAGMKGTPVRHVFFTNASELRFAGIIAVHLSGIYSCQDPRLGAVEL